MAQEKNSEKALREQRDRYVSFAFASGDLFLEISQDGKIIDVSGASKGITGIDEKSLLGRKWLDLFSAYELARLQKAHEQTVPGRRIGPIPVALNEQIGQKIATFSAIRMPDSNRFYIVLGAAKDFVARIAPLIGLPGSVGFAEDFGNAAHDAIFDAKQWGQDVSMTVFDLSRWGDIEKFKTPDWGKTQTLIGEVMAQYSFGGYSAGQLAEGKYSFVHDKNISLDEVKQKILDIAKSNGADIKPSDLQAISVEGDMKNMEKKDLARAVDFTIQEFTDKGATAKVETFSKGYKQYLSTNEAKLKEFKTIIERVTFSQVFQPVVKIDTKELYYYEILTRFEKGDAKEWIHFGEDAGLAPDFDLAVCERAMNYVKFKAGNNRHKFSINISPQSLSNEKFFEKLKDQLNSSNSKGIKERLQFEITEAANIENFPLVIKHIRELQKDGIKVALDDFGPGAAAAFYLQNLKPDMIKIDGKYIRRLPSSARDQALIKNLAQLCSETNIVVIGECVEDQAQADALVAAGIKYAEGHLYAPAGAKPDYIAKT